MVRVPLPTVVRYAFARTATIEKHVAVRVVTHCAPFALKFDSPPPPSTKSTEPSGTSARPSLRLGCRGQELDTARQFSNGKREWQS